MFKLKIFCNDGNVQYWDEGVGIYKTYDQALIACYNNALEESKELMFNGNVDNWFEVCENFEVTDTYATEKLPLGTVFPVATIHCDKAPWERENDCEIKILTGYDIVEIK